MKKNTPGGRFNYLLDFSNTADVFIITKFDVSVLPS